MLTHIEDLGQSWNKELNAAQWQLDAIKRNPEYCGWGIGGDAMSGDEDYPTWQDFAPFELDNLNELVNFYFAAVRSCVDCAACGGTGKNAATNTLSEQFYSFDNRALRWCDKLTQDEVNHLFEQGRLYHWQSVPTAEEVNKSESGGFIHDAINRHMLIEFRAKAQGVYGECEHCNGQGELYTEDAAHLELNLWVIHPRKGRSFGTRVNRIEEKDMPDVLAFLRAARDRNAARFGKLD